MTSSVGQVSVTVRTNTKVFTKELRQAARKEGMAAGDAYGNAFCKNASDRIKKCIDRTMRDSNRNSDKQGTASGKSFGNGFSKGAGGILTKRMKAILGGIIAFAQPLVMAAQGAAGGFLALAGSLAQAAGAAGALVPLLVGAAGSMAAIKIGTQGVGDSFKAITKEWKEAAQEGRAFNMQSEDIQKTLKTLTPAARGTAEAFGRMQKPLDDMRRSVQEALFKDMEETLDRLAKNVLPGLSTGLTALAGSVNSTARGFATMLEGADLGGMFAGLAPAMTSIGNAFVAFSKGFLTFVTAATPAATALAGSIERAAVAFSDWMSASAESGGINDFLTTALSQLQSWWNLLKAVGGALSTVLGAGAATGQSMVDSLTGIINTWNDFLKTTEGQTGLADFFKTSKAVIEAFGPVLKGLSEGIQNIVTPNALAMFEQLGVSIGGILPVVGQLLGVFAQTGIIETVAEAFNLMGQAIQPLMPILQQMATIISANLATVLPILGQAFRDIVAAIQPMMQALLPLVSALLPALISAFQPVIKVVVQVAQAIAATLTPIIKALTPIIGTLAPVIVGAFIAFNPFLRILMVLGPILAFIGPAIGKLVAWFINLIAPLAPIIAKIGELVFSFIAFNRVFGLIGRLFAPVIGWFKKGGEAASGLGGSFKAVFTAVGEVLRGFLLVLQAVGNFLRTVFVGTFRVVGGVIKAAVELWLTVFKAVFGVIVKVVETAISVIGGIWARVGGYVTAAFDVVKAVVQVAIEFVVGYFNMVKTTWTAIWAGVKAVITTVWSFITTTIQVAIAVIRFYIQSVAAVFRAVWEGISAIAAGVWNGILAVVRGVMGAIGTVVSTWLNIVIGYFNLVKGVVLGVWNGIRSAASAAFDGIRAVVTTAKDTIVNAFNTAKTAVITAFNNVKAAVSLVVEAIKSLFRALPGSIRNLLSGIGAIFSNIFEGAYNKVKSWIDKIKNIVGGVGSWIKDKIPGLARGGIVMGPQTRVVGEEGPEAVIPLARPLSQIDPSVRKMAAMLRGKTPAPGGSSGGGGNTAGLVQNISVVSATANPVAVATEVMNKTLAMAVA